MTSSATPSAPNIKVVTVAQMTALEQASERLGVSMDRLMENAGMAVAEVTREIMGGAAGNRVAVLAGPGNNGADGFVAARYLGRWGAEVTVCLLTKRPDFDPSLEAARQYGVAVVDVSTGVGDLAPVLLRSKVVIDAVLGTGRARPLEGIVQEASRLLTEYRTAGFGPQVLSIDLPTGVNADTGMADPSRFTADVTVALGYPKAGLLNMPGAAHTGRLLVVDIGLPLGVEDEIDLDLELLTAEAVAARLPARAVDSHKGTFGHALVVAGSRNYVGAAFLASQGAIRAGAGLVTLATPKSVYPMAATKLTEAIHLPLIEDDDGRIDPNGANILRESAGLYSAMLVGCGMGFSTGTTRFVEKLLLDTPEESAPVIIDADGLNNLAQHAEWWKRLARPVVVTPHPGEMATMTGGATAEIQEDRVAMARLWASRWNAVVVLKGAYTVISEPQGITWIAPFANPGLASGGTGDVLSGIIVGLLAQGSTPVDAACCAVYLHGLAGDLVSRSMGNTGTIASDLTSILPETIAQVRQAATTKGVGSKSKG